ncbi:MAG TPA: AAA family ATPase [Myxococcota bacterium]
MRTVPIAGLPIELRVEDAVEAACAQDITFIEERLLRGQSVLVECDKEMVLFLFIAIRARLKRANGPRLVLIDGRPGPEEKSAGQMGRMIEQLGTAIRGGVDKTVLVLPHLDVLTTTTSGLTLEARETIPLLFENPEATVLAFRDPTFDVPRVIEGVFAARREITGIPREALSKIITQREARAISDSEFDPFALYKYVSGLNPVRCRRIFSELAHRHEAQPGRSRAEEIYKEIRKQTVRDDLELPNVSLDADVGGYAEVKERLKEDLIELVLGKDKIREESDIKQLEDLLPRGIIFYGPPGTGKTFFAKAIATALSATVIVVSGPELKSKWVGESEENLRRVFRKARQAAPAVVIFDEIDAFAHQRGTYSGSGVEHSMVNQLLTEMDGFRKNEMIFIIGTTNFLESLDGALMRPGRFEFMIEIPAPTADDRKAITEIYNQKMALGLDDKLIAHLVRRTEGYADREKGLPFAGDHIQAVARALKRQQLRTGAKGFTADDIDKALQRKTRRPVVLSPEEERVIAVHEGGHAILAMVLPKATPPEKITIASDVDGALGYVLRVARQRPYAITAEELRAEICVGLGGMEAERMVCGDISIGAYGDLQRCTQTARAMVVGHGMVDGLPPRVILDDERARDQLSPEKWAAVDRAIDDILKQETERARKLLAENRALHTALVELLLEKKVLDATAIAGLKPTGAATPASAKGDA